MSLGPRLDLRQSQSLVMTPQLQQAIRLLALSNLEIESFIAEELERNPLLESGSSEEPPAEAIPAAEPAENPADEAIVEADSSGEAALDIDTDSEDFHQDGPSDRMSSGDSGPSPGGGEDVDFDSFAAAEMSLQDHLIAQAGMILNGRDLVIARAIIEQLEETGYFCISLIEQAERIGVPVAEVERVLKVVQSFDPPGIAARNLAECLAIQAREADRYDPAMARLIDNLDYLAKGNRSALRRICGVDDDDLTDMIDELRAYDPKPGCRFSHGERVEAVVPDVFVTRRGAGWSIELNSSTLPRLIVNRTYYQELASGPQDRASRTWLSECLTSANWLTKALDQRARTIIRVATEIVKQQEGFFRNGIAHLRPLTLRTIADAVGLHESTISRVTSNKYLACERGQFELKYFFTSAIQSADGGEAVSAEAVKSEIKTLIAAEGDAILSDDTLVDLLKAKGFDIARRTVAKYREAMGIGSSVQRRRQRAMKSRAA